jgi:hypothetical protein
MKHLVQEQSVFQVSIILKALINGKKVDHWVLWTFFIYNLLVLLALSSSSSIIIKVCSTFGTIVSVQVGSLLTHWLRSVGKRSSGPRVPLPVITVSIYLFILDIIIPNNFNQCIKLKLITDHDKVNELFFANK